ncbi:helix-turn-helix domain-containing protein [Microcoleus sp. S28C3]|uniref:helix-turn-helix domain-containing protein n=1 Tax=Microcoleus sp. S28C3 TaxID=3055414 RepID=UPI00403FB590
MEHKKTKIIKTGGEKPRKLTVAKEILLTLVNLHQLPILQILGVQFDVSETTANDIFHPWLDVLLEWLPASLLK